MTFIPRIHENGNVCCSAEGHLCDKCKAHFTRAAQLRTAVPAKPHPYLPPDPYAAGLAPLRAELELRKSVMKQSPCPMEDPSYKPGNGSSPDPYKIALQRQKENR